MESAGRCDNIMLEFFQFIFFENNDFKYTIVFTNSSHITSKPRTVANAMFKTKTFSIKVGSVNSISIKERIFATNYYHRHL